MESKENDCSPNQEPNSTTSLWNAMKRTSGRVLSKITSAFTCVRNMVRMDEYQYIEPRDESRVYIANEVPSELEPMLSYLTRGQNGFVIEDDEGDTRSLIINVDFLDYTKLVLLLMGFNSAALLVMLIFRMICPVFYEDVRRQFVF